MKKRFHLSIYLYRIQHNNLLALLECDVSFAALVREALYYHVRGSKLNIFVDKAFLFNYKAKYDGGWINLNINLYDPPSIKYLEWLKKMHRMEFIRDLIAGSLIRPLYGSYYTDSRMIKLENQMISQTNLDGYTNLVICTPAAKGQRKIWKPKIIRPVEGLSPVIPDEWYGTPDPNPTNFIEEDVNEQAGTGMRKKRKKNKYGRKQRNMDSVPKKSSARFGFSEDDLADTGQQHETDVGSGGLGIRRDAIDPDDDFPYGDI